MFERTGLKSMNQSRKCENGSMRTEIV